MVKTSGLRVDIVVRNGSFERAIRFDAPVGITAIVGPSGCGKTSTLNCVAGLLAPTKGTISFDDAEWFDSHSRINVPPQVRRPGYVFQNVALFPHLTVTENVLFGLDGNKKATKLPQQNDENKDELLSALAEAFGIQDLLSRKPSQLSGGQAQRVALARALAPQPSLLLLDEPLNALDSKSRAVIAAKLKEIQMESRLTVLYVTHFLDESRMLADFVVDISEV